MRRSVAAIADVVDGKLTVCDTTSGALFELNPAGRLIWETCQGRTLDAIADDLERTYPEQPRATLEEDVRRYVSVLEASKLIQLFEDEVAAAVGG